MIDIRAMQRRLGVKDDGIAGPITYGTLFACVVRQAVSDRHLALGKGAARYFPGLIDTGMRLAHFVGQTAHESGSYRWLREIWGPTPAQQRYEGRRDLGNVSPGDGKRYLGRGLLQITGRSNYRAVGERLGIDLEGDPALAELPDIAVATACDYWRAHGLNRWADANDVTRLSRAINLGNPNSTRAPNGLAERIVLTARARIAVMGEG
jgi:putative chitinase